MKRSWGKHIAIRLLRSTDFLFTLDSDPERWAADRKQLSRMKASWVRVGCAGRPGVVVGTAKPSLGVAVPDWGKAVKVLGGALRNLDLTPDQGGSRTRPITCSEDWEKPFEEPKYTRVGWVQCSRPEELKDALRAIGIDASYRPTDISGRLWDVSWNAPADDPAKMAAVECVVASCR